MKGLDKWGQLDYLQILPNGAFEWQCHGFISQTNEIRLRDENCSFADCHSVCRNYKWFRCEEMINLFSELSTINSGVDLKMATIIPSQLSS